MKLTNQHHQIALTLITGIGSKRARTILQHFESIEAFFVEKKLNISQLHGIPKEFISHKHRIAALNAADKIIEELEKTNSKTIFLSEENYPKRLKQCDDAPLLLYYQGDFDFNPKRVVSIVGTRHASDYGIEQTEQLVRNLSESGATIVSGLAYGIDIHAHKSALQFNLPTLGVLGHGFDFLYPAIHKKTAKSMIENNGGLISEFVPSQKPEPAHFPMRNRIVAGMADTTVVIESGNKGGSLITANLSFDYNREVFAFPGDVNRPYSKGCNELIKNNKAQLITCADDLIKALNWEKKENQIKQISLLMDLNEQQQCVMNELHKVESHSLDNLSILLNKSGTQLSMDLFMLETKGYIKSLPGMRYKATV